MGLQTGFLGITGKLGGLVFKKDGTVATAPTSSRKITAIRTLENNQEFGVAASASGVHLNVRLTSFTTGHTE